MPASVRRHLIALGVVFFLAAILGGLASRLVLPAIGRGIAAQIRQTAGPIVDGGASRVPDVGTPSVPFEAESVERDGEEELEATPRRARRPVDGDAPSDAPSVEPDDAPQVVELHRRAVLASASNPETLGATTAESVTDAEGRPIGWRLHHVGAALTEIGIREGDVLTHVNGSSLETPDRVFEALGRHVNADDVSLRVVRDGRARTLRFRIVE